MIWICTVQETILCKGGGIESWLDPIVDIAGAAFAPATGGLSLLAPAALGVADAAQGNWLGALGNAGAAVGGYLAEPAIAGGEASLFGGAAPAAASAAAPVAGGLGAGASGADVLAGGAIDSGAADIGIGATGAAAGGPTAGALGGAAGGTGGTALSLGGGASGASGGAALNAGTLTAPAATTASGVTAPSTSALLGSGGGATSTAAANLTGVPFTAAQAPTGLSGVAGDIGGFLSENKGLILPAAALGASALMTPKPPAAQSGQNAAGSEVGGIASQLSGAASGTLPPGYESMVDSALQDSITQIKSRYSALGLSGSTMEAQDIAAANERAVSERANLASGLTTQAIQAAGLQNQIYGQIAQQQTQQDNALQTALANFAGAAAGGALKG